MNAVERVLFDDVTRLMDRLATSIPEGALEEIKAAIPTLRARLDDMEAKLAAARTSLVEDYARWKRTLDDLENLWALAVWRSAAEEREDNARLVAA